jgi:sugar transferase (PEP-CTERM/EpsH1 system associated)
MNNGLHSIASRGGELDAMRAVPSLRVLLVTPALPYPPTWGFGMRVFQFIRHLSMRHHVSVVTNAGPHDHEAVANLRRHCAAVHVVPFQPSRGRAKRYEQLSSLLRPTSHQRRHLTSSAMQTAIDQLLGDQQFDIVQVESSQMAWLDFGNVPVVLDEHNIEYELLWRTCREERSPARKLFNLVEFMKFRAEEHAAWRSAAGSVFTSAREEAIFRSDQPRKPSAVVANGVDLDYFRPNRREPDPDNIVFTGLMSYRPNVDAVTYFVRSILPRVRQVRPRVTFTIVGTAPPEEVRKLAGPQVTVTGRVADVRPYLDRASTVVVPLRMGSGTRLKVLEGLAMGKPMVSTALGCEGIAVEDGEHLLLGNDPNSFAQAVATVLEDRRLGTALGRNGRNLVEREYGWESLTRSLEAFQTALVRSTYRG